MKAGTRSTPTYEFQNIDWDTAVVVINDWNEPMPTEDNVKCWYLVVEQTNNGATAETLQLEITLASGTPLTLNIAADSGNRYYIYYNLNGTLTSSTSIYTLGSLDPDNSVPIETSSMRIRIRQTTAVDVVSASIEVNVIYATRS
jgi:hypothetical protein